MILSALCILVGLALESINQFVLRPKDRSGVALLPPLAIGAGVIGLPGLASGLRWAIVAAAFAVHFGLIVAQGNAVERRRQDRAREED